jgi:serine/threonine protein kinase
MPDSQHNPLGDAITPSGKCDPNQEVVRLAQESVDRHSTVFPAATAPVSAEEIARLTAVLAKLGTESLTPQETAHQGTFQLGRFEVLAERGKGGFGIVLHAFDPDLEREVALKIPRPERLLDGETPDDILREARVAARLEHPGIVPVYETGRWGPVWYIAAAYCPGPSLGDWLHERRSALPAREGALLVAKLADAIHHAHCRGVLHLDLKPDNILLKKESLESIEMVPMITDFGLSGWSRSETDGPPVRLGGTPSYMAPEQVDHILKDIGVATDIFALGAILADLLTGFPEQSGEGSVDRRRDAVGLPKGTSPDLCAVVQKCLATAPAARYTSARALADDLRRFVNGETLQVRQVRWPRACARWARRKPALASSLFLLAAAVGGGLTISGVLWLRAERHLTQFQQEALRRNQAERQIERSVLNLAWVTQKGRLSQSDGPADSLSDLLALQSFLADVQAWRRLSSSSEGEHVGIEAARQSLGLLNAESIDESVFQQSYRHGLECWQSVLEREPHQPQWRRALAAHLLTYQLRSEDPDWLAWRSSEHGVRPRLAAVVEEPYAELLVELSAFHLQNRRRSELSYSMLSAAIDILQDDPEKIQPAKRRLLLQAHNLAADAASYASRVDRLQVHRAAADTMVAGIRSPQDCSDGLAREVARTLARQAHDLERTGQSESAIMLFEQALAYLRHATGSGAYLDRDYLELVRLHGRIGRCHRLEGRQEESSRMFERSIEALNQAMSRTSTPQRVMTLRRAVTFSRYGQSLLEEGDVVEAVEAFKAAECDFAAVTLRQADSKGSWLASIRTLHSLGKYYASTGRYAESRRVYETSLRQLVTMGSFTHHPSVASLRTVAEAAIKELEESRVSAVNQGSDAAG